MLSWLLPRKKQRKENKNLFSNTRVLTLKIFKLLNCDKANVKVNTELNNTAQHADGIAIGSPLQPVLILLLLQEFQ